ncbi:ArsR/SmtB family transcription factor [Candidatus Frankia alpina]|uniref:ArsR/SmtB family transcription factor n=1 Tax=Candidatus Frankia alpina TaxID=2699483 RepID=UPI0013D5EA5B|nr:helix-turn-helix transcriptional regulator [Candidatus Frankia alpina]
MTQPTAAGGQARTPARTQSLTHRDPAQVSLQDALDALGDPVRRCILRTLAARPDWTLPCGSFDVPVSAATRSHHFTVLRATGLLEQRDTGPRRFNRLRRAEFDDRFPGLLDLILHEDAYLQT